MSEILITGASGFVGQNLVKYIKSGEIYLLRRDELMNLPLSVKTKNIIHLAGKAHDLKKTANADEYYKVNFELTKNLYDQFLKSDAEKFIFISSVKAVSDNVTGVLEEDAIPDPKTHYGKSKLMSEEYIQLQPLPQGKSYYILRPCMIHGPGNKGNLNLLYNFVKKGIPYPLAAFNNKRSFLSIDNLCFVINELIVNSNIPLGIYNVADDEPLSTNEVVNILGESLNIKARLLKIPAGIIRSLAKVGDVLHLPLTTERLNKLTENYVVSNRKIKNVINKPLPLASTAGLKITAESFNKL